MKLFINKAARAIKMFFSNPRDLLMRLKPYVLKAESGPMKINGINFNIDLELDPAMRKMYFGCYQPELTRLLERFLKKGDTFIDIGANVGYVSAFALGLVGETGNVHAFEPVPQYFARLRKIQEDNPEYNLHVNAVAVGEHEGTATIAVTNLQNIGWNTMVPDFMSKDTVGEEIEISVIRLTDYLTTGDVQNIRLVKIDTEGFEFPVMKGFQEFLRKSEELPILIIEMAPAAYTKLGTTSSEVAHFMSELGYISLNMDCVHAVQIDMLDQTTDVVFIPKAMAKEGIGR